MKKTTKWILSLITIALLLYALTVLEANRFAQGMLYSVLQKSAILAIAAVSMNLLNGFTGLFSLGQAGFMGIFEVIVRFLGHFWLNKRNHPPAIFLPAPVGP